MYNFGLHTQGDFLGWIRTPFHYLHFSWLNSHDVCGMLHQIFLINPHILSEKMLIQRCLELLAHCFSSSTLLDPLCIAIERIPNVQCLLARVLLLFLTVLRECLIFFAVALFLFETSPKAAVLFNRGALGLAHGIIIALLFLARTIKERITTRIIGSKPTAVSSIHFKDSHALSRKRK
jgi:hypothetical protein